MEDIELTFKGKNKGKVLQPHGMKIDVVIQDTDGSTDTPERKTKKQKKSKYKTGIINIRGIDNDGIR